MFHDRLEPRYCMRFAIICVFCIQLLFLGLQALSIYLKFAPQFIPHYVLLTQTDVIQRQNEDLQHFRQWGDPDGNSYERLEAMPGTVETVTIDS